MLPSVDRPQAPLGSSIDSISIPKTRIKPLTGTCAASIFDGFKRRCRPPGATCGRARISKDIPGPFSSFPFCRSSPWRVLTLTSLSGTSRWRRRQSLRRAERLAASTEMAAESRSMRKEVGSSK